MILSTQTDVLEGFWCREDFTAEADTQVKFKCCENSNLKDFSELLVSIYDQEMSLVSSKSP